MTCEYYRDDRCTLGLYGGNPPRFACMACIAQGQNNPEFAAKLFASIQRTHPPDKPRVSGCCDDARNPV